MHHIPTSVPFPPYILFVITGRVDCYNSTLLLIAYHNALYDEPITYHPIIILITARSKHSI